MKAVLCLIWVVVALVIAVPFFVSGLGVFSESWVFLLKYATAWAVMAILLRIVFAVYPSEGSKRNTRAIYFWSGVLIIGMSFVFFYKAYEVALTGEYLVSLREHYKKANSIYALVNLVGNKFGPYGASAVYIFIGIFMAYVGVFFARKRI